MNGQLGKFQLLSEIATGGMAEIHIAKQTLAEGVDKLVVIKMLRPDLKQNREFVHMFLNEARIAARLIHPNVVQMYDLGYTEGDYYIAMEYVHGENMRSITNACKRRKQLFPMEHTLHVIRQTCQGLHHAHTKTDVVGRSLNIVHCDMSPQNIIVSFAGEVKILDFGVAMAASRFKEAGKVVVKGKLAYMSPEQCMGKTLDARSDIFSVGTLLWELVTGKRLYKYPSMGKVVKEICDGDIPSPRQYNPKIPPYLEAIIRKALSKQPEARYQSTAELREALESVVEKDGLTSSTSELRSFMRTLFVDKLEKVSQIEKAAEAGSLESVLFHDLAIEPDEISAPVPGDFSPDETPHAPPPIPTDLSVDSKLEESPAVPRPSIDTEPAGKPLPARLAASSTRRRIVYKGLIIAAGAAILCILVLVLVSQFGTGDAPKTEPDQPVVTTKLQGIVKVVSKPSEASVSIDGVKKGVTPCIVQKLHVGTAYNLEVSKPGYHTWNTLLQLEKNFDVQKFDVTLQRAASRGWGQVLITTEPPGAKVELDGKPVDGTTPLTLKRITANRKHALRAQLEDHGVWTSTFSLRPNQSLKLSGVLAPEEKPGPDEPQTEEALFEPKEPKEPESEAEEAEEVEPDPEEN